MTDIVEMAQIKPAEPTGSFKLHVHINSKKYINIYMISIFWLISYHIISYNII